MHRCRKSPVFTSRSQWSLQLGSSPSCVEFPSHARQFCAKTCLFKPPKICFQSDVWWGNGKYLRLLFSFTLSPLQLGRIHVPRWHKMYDAPFFSVKSPTSVTLQWLYRAPCHLLRALLSKIICDGTPVMTTTAQAEDIGEHLIMGLNWEFISMFISEPKSGASLFSSLLLQLDQSLITEIPELTSLPITSGVTDIIRHHQRTFHVFLMLIHDPRLLFVKAMESRIGR